ncbi:MAG: hypothetical protein J5I81_03135 [Nitrococcus mobilis]|nr:hypothetical protein [Nitrococcus mobilis]
MRKPTAAFIRKDKASLINPKLGNAFERFSHGLRRRLLGVGYDVHGHIHAQLDCAGQIDGDDVLPINVLTQLIG